eukprot:PhM_4_TR12428/c1_g1_i1/m.86809
MQRHFSSTFLGWLGFGQTIANVLGGMVGGHATEQLFVMRHIHGITIALLGVNAVCYAVLFGFVGVGTTASVLWSNTPTPLVVAAVLLLGHVQDVLCSFSYIRPLLLF